jgi:hypothetical protein
MGKSANVHPLPDVNFGDPWPFRCNNPHHLMTGHERILANPPFIFEHAQIAIANAAIFHLNLHLFISEGARFIFKRLQFDSGA